MIGGIFVGSVTSVSVAVVLLELIEPPLPLVKLNGFTVGPGVATTATCPVRFTCSVIAEMPYRTCGA